MQHMHPVLDLTHRLRDSHDSNVSPHNYQLLYTLQWRPTSTVCGDCLGTRVQPGCSSLLCCVLHLQLSTYSYSMACALLVNSCTFDMFAVKVCCLIIFHEAVVSHCKALSEVPWGKHLWHHTESMPGKVRIHGAHTCLHMLQCSRNSLFSKVMLRA